MRYRRNRRTQRGLDPPSFKRCPVLLYGGTLEAQGAASFRGPSGGRPSPTWGARRWGRGRLLPRTQRAPTLPRPGDPAGADPPPSRGLAGGDGTSSSRGTRGRRPSPILGTQRAPTSSSRGPSGCRPSPTRAPTLLLPGNPRAPTTPRLGDPASVRPPPPRDPHSARPLPPGDSLPLARSPASGPPCARRPRSSPPPEPTGPRCVLTVVAMVRPAPRLAHRQLTETRPDGGPARPQPPQSADGGPAPARPRRRRSAPRRFRLLAQARALPLGACAVAPPAPRPREMAPEPAVCACALGRGWQLGAAGPCGL